MTPWKEFKILTKIHPEADKYFMWLALAAGVVLTMALVFQVQIAIGLLV